MKYCLLVVLSLCIFACGDDDTPGDTGGGDVSTDEAAVCESGSCTCENNTCSCEIVECKVLCDGAPCSLNCDQGAKCDIKTEEAVTLNCNDASDCKSESGIGSVMICNDNSKCELKGGRGSTASCEDSADCKFTVGTDSSVSCETTTTKCDVKCEGTCEVECNDANCDMLECSESGVTPTDCGDGKFVCGKECS